MDYFLSSAHASTETNTQDFNQHKCYYAGWISFLKYDAAAKQKLCVHPRRIGYKDNQDYIKNLSPNALAYYNKISKKYAKFYGRQKDNTTKAKLITIDSEGKVTLKDDEKNCSQNENIACNPEIYGTNKETHLCVQSQGNYGLNASYACDKAIQYLKGSDKDAYKNHLNSVVEGIIKNDAKESQAVEILYSMYDTCLCQGKRKKTNEDYSKRIFNTRTCAGILSQTKHISSMIKKSCPGTENSSTDLNQNLIGYILKADQFLENEINAIRNIPFPDKDNQAEKRAKITTYLEEDKQQFNELSLNNYDDAKDANLCPIAENYTPPVAAEAEATAESSLNITPKEYIITDNKLYNLLDIKLKLNGTEIPTAKIMPENFEGISLTRSGTQIITETPNEEKEYTAFYNATPKVTSNKFTLGPPNLSCEVSVEAAAESATITFTPKLEPNISDFELTKNITDFKIEYPGANIELDESGKFQNKITVDKYKKTKKISASGKLNIGNNHQLDLKCEKEAQANNEIASCKVELSADEEETTPDGINKYNITSKITYKNDEGVEIEQPAGVSASYIWFDHSKPVSTTTEETKEKETSETGALASSVDNEEKKDEKEEEEEENNLISKLKNKYQTIKAKNNKSYDGEFLTGIYSQEQDRPITAVVTITKDDGTKVLCEEEASIEIPRFSRTAANNSPALSPAPNTNIIKSQGNAYQLQR